ncbi:MAG: hypothetical protein LBD38_02220 [Streptococcaceae bacterium]|jgi:two-component system phosphate regulon sensor histidine kinase PhoR|nr:hypothetical protein [Streptococcaceae bacterium]
MKKMSKTKKESLIAILVLFTLFLTSVQFGRFFLKEQAVTMETSFLEDKMNLFLHGFPAEYVLKEKTITQNQKVLLSNTFDFTNERFSFLDMSGKVIYDSAGEKRGSTRENKEEIQSILRGSSLGVSIRQSEQMGQSLIYFAKVLYNAGNPIGIVRIAEPTSSFENSFTPFFNALTLLLTVLFSLMTFFILRLIKQKNDPLEVVLPLMKTAIQKDGHVHFLDSPSKPYQELIDAVNIINRRYNKKTRLLETTDEQLKMFFKDLPMGICFVDYDDQISLFNPAFESLIRINKEETLFSKFFLEFELIHLMQQAKSSRRSIHKEVLLSTSQKQVDVNIHFLEVSETNVQFIFSIFDLTEFRRLEKQQRDFVGNVSHELKTPVTSLIGFTETLLDGAMEDKEILKQFLEIMQKDALRLEHLISEILELSRDHTNSALELSQIEVLKAFVELKNTYHKLISQKNLEVQILGTPEIHYIANQNIFFSILKNLFENAVHYSKENGKITIYLEEDVESFIFYIEDNGIGLSVTDRERIFERFYRADKTRNRNTGGTGLGLSIVKNNVDLLHGSIVVTSQLGVGTRFTVRLPKTS